jgi:hypothetical protein
MNICLNTSTETEALNIKLVLTKKQTKHKSMNTFLSTARLIIRLKKAINTTMYIVFSRYPKMLKCGVKMRIPINKKWEVSRKNFNYLP